MSSKGLQEFNTEPIIKHNNKNLKMMQFELDMLVSSGVQHELLPRWTSGVQTKIDIVEGTFKLYKIETKKMLSPIKLFIRYKKSKGAEQPKASKEKVLNTKSDLKVLYSFNNPKPEESNCDGFLKENPQCITINAPGDERYFPREFVFLKLQTIMGCQAYAKLVFPKQDF